MPVITTAMLVRLRLLSSAAMLDHGHLGLQHPVTHFIEARYASGAPVLASTIVLVAACGSWRCARRLAPDPAHATHAQQAHRRPVAIEDREDSILPLVETRRGRGVRVMRTTICGVFVLVSGVVFAQPTVMIDDMTGTEVMEAVAYGKTTVIIYVGGLHENTYSAENTEYVGPEFDAVSINKHNLVAKYQARRIAEELGNALAYHPLPYTPARSHLKPGTAGGTVALSDSTFAAVLREMAASAIVSGFTDVVFIGEDGGGQAVIKKVAEDLDHEWSLQSVDVYFFPVYSDANKLTAEFLGKMEDLPEDCVESGIGGCISATTDASEVLFLEKENVRTEKISPAIAKVVSPELGRILNEQKVKIAVDYIRGAVE